MVAILWGSPLPPIRSGVSDYATELLAKLSQICSVRVLRPPGWDDGDWELDIPLVESVTKPQEGEIPLWHIGNNPYHDWLFERALHESAVLVIHDLVLHHLVVEATLAQGHECAFLKLISAAHPRSGERLAVARTFGMTARRDPFLFPARKPILARAHGAIVHSRWAAEQIARDDPSLTTEVVNLCVQDPGQVDRDAIRKRLGIEPNTFLLLHLGFLTPDKGLESVLIALASALRCGARVHLVLVGQDGGGAENLVQSLASKLGIEDKVTTTGWVPDQEMSRLPAAADLGIVLRDPSAGETSAAVLRFLACGTPVAVAGLHQYLEWPQSAAIRITPGPAMAADLARSILRIGALAPKAKSDARQRAREVYLASHTPEATAQQLVSGLKKLVDSAP
ncbi:MAG: glycosyltransferase [bacterium]|nr:glycosyltransferase [bacterium]